ncbi:DegV family protein [Paenibacillus sonchi]|uniref:DegV family protein n=1 Tax=Paenibacillus sonchi TaxID=373687 RepID=A0A974PHN8_9BACL|nr:DegV family protein [Paenibacillus sonchi]
MINVHIFTDSLTTLPQDMIAGLNISIVQVYIVFSNAQVYRHTEDISTDKLT